MDVHDSVTRSYNMSRIKGKDTKPEELVRKYLFSQGFRYRKNDPRLPGKPDIVLPKYRTVVFVNGCFWHHHDCRYYFQDIATGRLQRLEMHAVVHADAVPRAEPHQTVTVLVAGADGIVRQPVIRAEMLKPDSVGKGRAGQQDGCDEEYSEESSHNLAFWLQVSKKCL